MIEARKYNQDSTEEEIDLILKQVSIVEDGIILIREIPVTSPSSIRLVLDQASALGKQFDRFALLIDLTITNKPDSETRRVINERFAAICNEVSHVSFVTGRNVIMNTILRFVMYRTNLNSYSVHKDQEEGYSAIRKILDEGKG